MSQFYGEIYQKVLKGDPLTDSQVKLGAAHFRDLAQSLGALGPNFHLAWKEANHVYTVLDGYCQARAGAWSVK